MDDRTPEKKPFQLDLSFDDDTELDELLATFDETPKPKGEVYFSNPPPRTKEQLLIIKKKRKQKGFSAVMILVVASLCVALVVSYIGIMAMRDIFAIGKDPADTREVPVVLSGSPSTAEVVDILADHNLIRMRMISQWYARFTYWLLHQNFENPRAPVYLAGEHLINVSWGLEEMLDSMREQRRTAETVTLTFPEHFTVRQIFNRLADNRVASFDSLMHAMRTAEFDYHFLRAFEQIDEADIEGRFFLLEGYLFPDTYEFYVGERPISVISRFLDNFNRRWTPEFHARARELGMTVDEVIILASIIQHEAANQEQMGNVSSVLHNRMNNRAVFPRLQCDATRDYVMDNIAPLVPQGVVAHYNAIFNTYVRDGWPAGPIGNPGIDAIEAALWPYETDYYFFQHDRYRRIYMSRTRQEHNRITADLVIQGINQ